MSTIRIEVTQEGQPPQTYHFDHGDVEVGRSPDCDLVLHEPGISSLHAKVVLTDDACLIIDEQSTNGTYLHGSRIAKPTPVQPSDTVYICNYRLRIHAAALSKSKDPSLAPPPPFGDQAAKAPALSPPPFGASAAKVPAAPATPPAPAAPAAPPTVFQDAATQMPGSPPAAASAPPPRVVALEQPQPGVVEAPATTLAPRAERDKGEPGRAAAQKISVQSNPGSVPSVTAGPGIEMRNWPVPGAPPHISYDERILAQVFAAMAQPWIERQELPPGDNRARAEFYALAQAQLSINLSPQSTQMEIGAERIVRSLCAIGPLSDLLQPSFFALPNNELQAQPYRAIRSRVGHEAPWTRHDQSFIHPWALRFATWRLLGRDLDPRETLQDHRLSNGLRLSAIGASACEDGPWLSLTTPPAMALGWDDYCEQTAISHKLQQLLRAAVQTRRNLVVCEQDTGPSNLWNALHDLAREIHPVVHIGWSARASYDQAHMQLCADRDPQRQADLFTQALSLDQAPIIAIDNLTQACRQALARPRDLVRPAIWTRVWTPSVQTACEPMRHGELSSLSPGVTETRVGLVVCTRPVHPNKPPHVVSVAQFEQAPGQPMQLSSLFESSGQELRYVGKSPTLYPQMAQEGVELSTPA